MFLNISIFRKFAIFMFCIFAIFVHLKQRKIMRRKQNFKFCKKQII